MANSKERVWYEITVTQSGIHLFDTRVEEAQLHSPIPTGKQYALYLAKLFVEKFPLNEGYLVSLIKYVGTPTVMKRKD